jgi:transcription antitermination factor NusB
MRKRTLAREFALQILYQFEITKEKIDDILSAFWDDDAKADQAVKDFTTRLTRGTTENISFIDERIIKYATNWELDRMAIVDRNILRMGCFELLFLEDIPPKVAINEAVEIAKKYSGEDAGKFVNGILDKIKLERKFPNL